MALAELLIRSTLGRSDAPASLQLALFRSGAEVGTQGYSRFDVAKGSWRVDGSKASVEAKFGPFLTRTSFDTLVLFDGRTMVDRIEIGETVVPAGMLFTPTPGFAIG